MTALEPLASPPTNAPVRWAPNFFRFLSCQAGIALNSTAAVLGAHLTLLPSSGRIPSMNFVLLTGVFGVMLLSWIVVANLACRKHPPSSLVLLRVGLLSSGVVFGTILLMGAMVRLA